MTKIERIKKPIDIPKLKKAAQPVKECNDKINWRERFMEKFGR